MEKPALYETGNDNKQYMTVVIEMPSDTESSRAITNALGLGNTFHGGSVTAVSLRDEITKIEKYEEKYGDME